MTLEQPLEITILKHLGFIPAILIGLPLESFVVLAVFMVVDTLVGIVKSMVIDGCRSFRSFRLAAGVSSKGIIILVPLLVAWAGKGAGVDLTFLAQSVLGLLIFSELYSILGNLHAIRMRKHVPEWDAVNFVLQKVQAVIEALIRNGSSRK